VSNCFILIFNIMRTKEIIFILNPRKTN
jgi:hypothetical protein